MTNNKTSRIDKIEEQIKRLDAERKRIIAREKQEERKKETRRNIIVGAIVRKNVQDGEWPEDKFMNMLDNKITRGHDRKLFGLSVKNDAQKDSNADLKKS